MLEILCLPENILVVLTLLPSFQNLIMVCMVNCRCDLEVDCIFFLTDDDVSGLAATLPYLTNLWLREVCDSIACRTTASSLSLLTTLCPELTFLDIHFDTR